MSKIDLDNIQNLERLKESLNKTINKRINEQKVNNYFNNDLNFYTLKTLFECISSNLFDSKNSSFKKYIKIIKENKDLKLLYSLHERVMNPTFSNSPETVVNSMVKLTETIDKKSLKENEHKLSNILKEGINECSIPLNIIEESLSKNKNINESLYFILTNKVNDKNLFEYSNNVHNVLSHINENMEEKIDVEEKDFKSLIKDLNENIKSENPWETEALTDIALCTISDGSKQELFETYKSACINLLEEKISISKNIEERSRFLGMKNSLERKEFNEDTLNESILKLSELKKTLSDI